MEKQEQLFEGGEEETEKEKQPTHRQPQVNSVEKGEHLFGGGEQEEEEKKKNSPHLSNPTMPTYLIQAVKLWGIWSVFHVW